MDIFLVGNGPTGDLSQQIDAADLVIRMNKVPTMGKTTGTKTDILVLVNTGTPGEELLSRRGVRANPAFKIANEIRLPVCPMRAAKRREDHPERRHLMTEWSHMTKETHFRGKTITTVPGDLVSRLEDKLNSPVPSTGMIMAEQLVQTRQPGDVIYLCGFAHSGWDGHPWEAEKALIDSYVEQGFIIRV